MRSGVLFRAIVGGVLIVRMASAEEPDGRERARSLATQGDQLFGRGRCDLAIARWTEADAAYHAPTIVLRVARCEALLGHVVQAAERLEAIAAEGASPGEGDAFRLAREQAARELPAIRGRIAHLEITVEGAWAAHVRVEIDGHLAEPGVAAVDPGPHEVRVTSGTSSWSRRERVVDGETRSVRVGVIPRPPESRWGERVLGYAVGAAGMATMAVGAGFGAASVSLSHSLFGACGPQGNACPPGRQGQIDTLKQDAFVSDFALGTGAALFLTGAIVLLIEKATRAEKPVQLDLVGTGLTLHGGF